MPKHRNTSKKGQNIKKKEMNRSTRKSKPVTRKKKVSMRKKRTQRRIKRGGAAAAPAVVNPEQIIKERRDQMKELENSKNIFNLDYLHARQARVLNLLHKGQIERKKVKGNLGPSVNENDIFNGTLQELLSHIHNLESRMSTTIFRRDTINYLNNEIKILEEMQERTSEETIPVEQVLNNNTLKRTGSNLTENNSNGEQSSPKRKKTTPEPENDNGYDTVINDSDSNNDD